MRNPFRIGTDIYLRPLEPEDVPSLTDWTTRPAVRTALDLFYRPLDQSAAELFLDRTKNDAHDIALGIVAQETETLLGFIGLNRIDQENSHVQLGFFLGEQKADSECYLSEAISLMQHYVFAVLGMNRLWLYVDAAATQTITMLEQQGFVREATLRQDRCLNGRSSDTVVMGQVKGRFRGRELLRKPVKELLTLTRRMQRKK